MISYDEYISIVSNNSTKSLLQSNPNLILIYSTYSMPPVLCLNTSDYFFVAFINSIYPAVDLDSTLRINISLFEPQDLRDRIADLQKLYYGKTDAYYNLPVYPFQSNYHPL